MFACVLGSKQIKKRLGKDIFIEPFREENLKGCSYNLTATQVAFYADDKKLALDKSGNIVFPPHKTVLIQTEESIYVRKNICATYHTKVSLATKGFSSISTTLDPEYFGGSLIAITNLSNETQTLRKDQSIVTLIFYRVSGCNKEIKDNTQNRDDLMPREFSKNDFSETMVPNRKDVLLDNIIKERKKSYKNDYKELIKTVRKNNDIKPLRATDWLLLLLYLSIIGIIVFLNRIEVLNMTYSITLCVPVIPFILHWIKDNSERIRSD